MSSQVMSKVFWQLLKSCTGMYHALLGTLRMDLLQNSTRIYGDRFAKNRDPSPNCRSFMEGAAITTSIKEEPNVIQRACYTGHNGENVTIYLSLQHPVSWYFIYKIVKLGSVTIWPYTRSAVLMRLWNNVLLLMESNSKFIVMLLSLWLSGFKLHWTEPLNL